MAWTNIKLPTHHAEEVGTYTFIWSTNDHMARSRSVPFPIPTSGGWAWDPVAIILAVSIPRNITYTVLPRKRDSKSKWRRDRPRLHWSPTVELGSKPGLLTPVHPSAYLAFSFSLNITSWNNKRRMLITWSANYLFGNWQTQDLGLCLRNPQTHALRGSSLVSLSAWDPVRTS